MTGRRLPLLRRIVVKVGSGLIADPGRGPDPARIGPLAADLAAAVTGGLEVALVSSGAIAAGTARLGLRDRPRSIPEKQAAAAVGQAALMWHYEQALGVHGRLVAQVLLTQADISDRTRYLNARNTLLTLLSYGVIPVVNENDTVAVEEIKVGDNDNLAALVAHLVDADLLVLLSDIDGLYTGDPHREPDAQRIELVESITPELERGAGRSGPLGTGGMVTKLQAAQKAMAAGIPMVVTDGRLPGALGRVIAGEPVGTYFQPRTDRLAARKRWIAFAVPP
ncbi:MAG TPA: glutamate 5-kinase, partial [Methylomirabilota bacterium]|nr:glutamate 5-kinase [Methylomirabilota bacterium]